MTTEEILHHIISEMGIVKIIIDYKKQLEKNKRKYKNNRNRNKKKRKRAEKKILRLHKINLKMFMVN
tara:strand:+ start:913 stop:1113 length:201 start_codon:yes stop_codon:yes gene_type:complete